MSMELGREKQEADPLVEVLVSLKSNEKNTSETSLASGKFPSMKFISALPPPALSCRIYKLKHPLIVDTESMNRECMLCMNFGKLQ